MMKNTDLYKFLSQFTIFKNLTDQEMEPIVDISNSRVYEPGTMVFMQHEPIRDVYFIQEGEVKIFKTDYDGKEQIINVLQKDDMFPHQGFFRNGDYPAHAEIISKARLVNIPILSFENFLLTHPEICIKMFKVLSGIIVELQQRLEEKIMYNINDQIGLLLMRLSRKSGTEIKEGVFRINLKFTNSELANMIGSSRETISRCLTRLKKAHLIDVDKTGHLIVHYGDLEREIIH